MWKKVSSKILLQHARLTVIEDDIVLHTGRESTYVRLEVEGHAVAIIAQREDGKILLEREYSYPQDIWLYQLPGGGVPLGESIEDGAQRELQEETGYGARKMELLGKYYPNNRRSIMLQYVFYAQELYDSKLPHDHEEVFEFFWLTEDEIDDLIKKGEIINASLLASWSMYKAIISSRNTVSSLL